MLIPTHKVLGFENQFIGEGQVQGGGVVQPYGVFTTETPAQEDNFGTIELFTKIQSSAPGTILGVRFWKTVSDVGTHTGRLWSNETGSLVMVRSKDFVDETASGWQTVLFDTPFPWDGSYIVLPNVICYGNTPRTIGGLTLPVVNGVLSTVADGFNGMWTFTPGNPPDSSSLEQNLFRDIIFLPD